MTEEEVETLLAGHEDANGCINYEGESGRWKPDVGHSSAVDEWNFYFHQPIRIQRSLTPPSSSTVITESNELHFV